MQIAISQYPMINEHRHDVFMFATHSATVTAINVDTVMLSRHYS